MRNLRQSRRMKIRVIFGYMNQPNFKRLETNISGLYPHRPVINPNKPGKVRRVGNAASEFEGHSLNKSLFIGPDLLQILVGIIFRFWEKSFGMSRDIEAMFLQVQVPPEDAKCRRFVWRENQSDDISTYEYTRHIFGAKDSPTCANYALQRTAMDNEEEFPVAMWTTSCILRKVSTMPNF